MTVRCVQPACETITLVSEESNHALERRTAKARRRAGKVGEMYADQIQGMIFGVCVSDMICDMYVCMYVYKYRFEIFLLL